MLLKMSDTLPPAAATAATATSAINATRSAYSSKSCPSSSHTNFWKRVTRFIGYSLIELRSLRELAGDVVEDRRHAAARRRDGRDRDERDQRHEERVLEQVLPFLVAHERTKPILEIHDVSSRR